MFLFFLAFDAVARPGNGLEPLVLHFLLARDAQAVFTALDSDERVLNQLEDAPVVIALMKEKFLGIGIGGLVGDIVKSIVDQQGM